MNEVSRQVLDTIVQAIKQDRPELKVFPYPETRTIMIHDKDDKLVTSIEINDE